MAQSFTTAWLLLRRKLRSWTGTPRYRRVLHRSTIWSTAILAATNFDPKVAVCTQAWRLENNLINVWLQRCKIPDTKHPVIISWYIICVHIVYSNNRFTMQFRYVLGNFLLDITIDTIYPIKLLDWKCAEVWLINMHPCWTIWVALKEVLKTDDRTNNYYDYLLYYCCFTTTYYSSAPKNLGLQAQFKQVGVIKPLI
jgi:hypothetical protein